MNLPVVGTVYQREVLDLLRDRRTLFSMVVLPTIVFPLLFAVIGKFVDSAGKRASQEATTLAVGKAPPPPSFDRAITGSGLTRVAVDDVPKAVQEKKAAAGVTFSADGRIVSVYADGTRQASGRAADKLRAALTELRDSTVLERLRAANLGPETLKPFELKRENVADERKMGGFLLGSMLGYVVILLMFSGGMYPAVDMTAGEKERKTLEALLATPAGRTEIVLGKILACVTATYATAILTTASLFYSLRSGSQFFEGAEKFIGSAPVDAKTLGLLLLTLMPVAVMAGALMIAIATAARSFKEAQSYLTPLIMVVIFPSLLGGLPGMELNAMTSLIPIFNASQVLKGILQGDIETMPLVVTNLANVGYAALCFWVAVRTFNDEKVLFRT
jgi:sodium transport system permease protein